MPPYICPDIDRGFPQPYTTTKNTDLEERLTTATDHDDQEGWPRRRLTAIHICTILTYQDASVCNFWHTWTCLSGKFRCFAHCDERTMRRVHCKTTCLYITFRLTKTCICITINILHYVFYLPFYRYTWILIPPRDLLTYKSFSICHY